MIVWSKHVERFEYFNVNFRLLKTICVVLLVCYLNKLQNARCNDKDIVGSISITSFSLHIQCRLDCLSLDCLRFLIFRAYVLNSMSFLCSAQNSVEVLMAVCTRDFQALTCFLSAAVVLYSCVLFCDLICILIEPSEKKSLYSELSGNSR